MLGLSSNRFYDWVKRAGQENQHNGKIPKDTWLMPEEKDAIVEYHAKNPLNGYRRLTYMMMDEDVVHCSPNSVYRVLKAAGVLDKSAGGGSKKGTGFVHPTKIDEHWHVDISYLNVCGTFYYLCSVLDGYSRYIVHHEIREKMTEADVEIVIHKAFEKRIANLVDSGMPEAEAREALCPRVISDRGPQFIAKDFKSFIRFCGMTHVLTSPYYPQSNGKIERWHKEMKQTYRSKEIGSIDDARRTLSDFVDDYNHRRLHAALGYVTPFDKHLGLEHQLQSRRTEKCAEAHRSRKLYWANANDRRTEPLTA